MYPRLLAPPTRQSFFLFGPRGVGKTAWVRARFPEARFFGTFLVHPGTRRWPDRGIEVVPAGQALRTLGELIR